MLLRRVQWVSLTCVRVAESWGSDVNAYQLLSFLQLRHGCGELDSRLPPDREAQADEAVERAPHYFGGRFEPVGRLITREGGVKGAVGRTTRQSRRRCGG